MISDPKRALRLDHYFLHVSHFVCAIKIPTALHFLINHLKCLRLSMNMWVLIKNSQLEGTLSMQTKTQKFSVANGSVFTCWLYRSGWFSQISCNLARYLVYPNFGKFLFQEIPIPFKFVPRILYSFVEAKLPRFLQFICLVFRGDRPNKKGLIAFCIKTTSFFIWHIWPYACCDLRNYSWIISATLYSNSDDHRLLHRANHYYSLTYM